MKLFWYEFKINKPWKLIDKVNKWYAGYNLFNDFAYKDSLKIDLKIFYDLYKKNSDIRWCIRKIAQAVSKNWVYLQDMKGQDVSDNKSKLALLYIDSLIYNPTFLYFKTELFKHFLLSWELYITDIRNWLWQLIGFQILDSRSMSKLVDENWNITWFKQYSSWWWKTKSYSRDDVAYYQLEKDVNNENLWMWLMDWIVREALSDFKSSQRNYYFFENNAVPNAILMLDWTLSDNEMKIAKEQFEKEYRWTNNSHKLLIWWWIKDIKVLSMTQKDMEFINQKKLTTEKISATFWVSKRILWYDYDTSSYANFIEMRIEYIEWTIRPYEWNFQYILNSLMKKFDPKFEYIIKCDWETVVDRNAIEENQRKDLELWLVTIDEIRLERWNQPFKTEQSKEPLMKKSITLLKDIETVI